MGAFLPAFGSPLYFVEKKHRTWKLESLIESTHTEENPVAF